jgi:hypothetical protein
MSDSLGLIVECRTMAEANRFDLEHSDTHRFDRWSEARGVYIFVRRSKPR